MSRKTPTEYYQDRLQTHEAIAGEQATRADLVSTLRKLIFTSWIVLFFLAATNYLPSLIGWSCGIASLVCFVGLLVWHERLHARMRESEERADIARRQLARLQREWRNLPEQNVVVPESAQGISDDLDLFGHASVYQLICRANSPAGRSLLRDWLLAAACPSLLADRHAAVRELAPLRAFREDLDLRGRLLAASPSGPDEFIQWAEGPHWLRRRPWLRLLSRCLVATLLVAPLLGVTGIIPAPLLVVICLAVLAANLVLSVLLVGAVHDIFERVDSRHRDIQYYRDLFMQFDELSVDAPLLAALRQKMSDVETGPRLAISRLARIMRLAQLRHSSLMGIFHLGLQLVLLIDFHVLDALEFWQSRHGAHVRDWFAALAELEALASLASLCHDHPDWQFPSVTCEANLCTAQQIGHPLLAAPVRNDVSLGPAGRFLLVSGSNMSGKSTLLRALGVNAVLAQAGSPVCADSFTLPPVEIATSMRVHDSLENGVSFFMAELNRLKAIVDRADKLQARQDRTLLFLLDEILQGTNSSERHIAVTRVVHRLTRCGAMGAITTHDLDLARSQELAAICDPVHFQESFLPSGEMTFDYRMRPGIATSTNALKLLAIVGLD